ncbi:hypothetical protein ACWEOE_26860 [Amycolatopsis sp. NPDC004368]
MATNAGETGRQHTQSRTVKISLPFAPDFQLPRVQMPARNEISAALDTARSYLPPPRQMIYFGALGVLTAVELIEWPVAVAIGVGTTVAGRVGGSRGGKPARATTRPAPVGERRAPGDRARTAGQPEVAGAHQPVKRPRERVVLGERPAPAGQPEIAGAHSPVSERKPSQAVRAEPESARQEPSAAPEKLSAAQEKPPAPAKPAKPVKGKAKPASQTTPRANPESARSGGGPAHGGE